MNHFNKKSSFWVLLIVILVFISYGQTLQMYFWQDDSALIFKLQNPDGAAGSFGAGLFERGAYRYLIVPFVPFYPIFKLEPFGYFLIGFLTYLMSTAAFFLFSKELFKSKLVGYIATMVFAAGYIGSNTMFRIANSWQTNIGIVSALITFWLYIRYLQTKKAKYYLFSILAYLSAIELVFIRSHSIIFPIILLEVLFALIPFKLKEIPKSVFRLLPFLILFKQWYLQDESFGGPGILNFLKAVLLQGELERLAPLFASLGNVFVPNAFQDKLLNTFSYLPTVSLNKQVFLINLFGFVVSSTLIYLSYRFKLANKLQFILGLGCAFLVTLGNNYFFSKDLLWYKDIQSVTSGAIGLHSFLLVFFFGIVLFKIHKQISLALILGWVIVATQFFGYYVQYPTVIFSTTHRYFSYSFIGYSIIYGVLLFFAYNLITGKKNKLIYKLFGIIPFVFIIGLNLVLSLNYQRELVVDRSIPSRNFYNNLKTFVPKIEKGSTFYFDVANEGFYQRQFGDFFSVGSMPESTALAIYYGVDRYDINYITDFDELVFKIQNKSIDIDKIYTFYYGPKGLINTTDQIKTLLKEGSPYRMIGTSKGVKVSEIEQGDSTLIPAVTVSYDLLSLPTYTPIQLEIEATVTPHNFTRFPTYYINKGEIKEDIDTRRDILLYLNWLKDYFRDIKVTSLSEWKHREVVNVVDNDINTVWQGHRIFWGEKQNEELVLDLGRFEEVSKLVWTSWIVTLAPRDYKIETSIDNKNWEEGIVVTNKPVGTSGELIEDSFKSRPARYVRMVISKTNSDDSPALADIIVVPTRFSRIPISTTSLYSNNPLVRLLSEEEYNLLSMPAYNLASMNISWPKNSINLPVVADGRVHNYTVFLKDRDIQIPSLSFSLNIPANVTIHSLRYKNLSLDEMKVKNLIKEVSEN
jgi:hypothetical protein